MQITNSFINKHCERIKCSAYAAPIKEARLQGVQRVASGKGQGASGARGMKIAINVPWLCLHA